MLTIHLWLLGVKTLLKFGKNYKLVQIKLYNGYTITGRLNNLSLNISISGVGLNVCTETKLLGIIIDNSLSWEKQTEYICSKVTPKIGI